MKKNAIALLVGVLGSASAPAFAAAWDFAGMYQIDDCGTDTVGNPLNGGLTSCQSGFTASVIGRVKAPDGGQCGVTQYVCQKSLPAGTGSTYLFGGSFQIDDCGTDNLSNPATGAMTCPSGYTRYQYGRIKAPDGGQCGVNQYFCRFTGSGFPSIAFVYGGQYQVPDLVNVNTIGNFATGDLTCPQGFTAYRVGRAKAAEGNQCGANQWICLIPYSVF